MLMGTDQYTVDEMELHEIPTPKQTRTHHPVPHGVFASEVEKVIAHNGFSINRTDKTRVCLAGTGSECQRLELSVACYQNFRTGRHRPAEFHPQMDAIIEKVEAEVEVWRCQKHTRDEYALPDGPKSVRSQGNRVNNP